MLQTRLSSTLDGGDFGWLKAKHHFSVSRAGNPANKHTICIGNPGVPAHLAHGDFLGSCCGSTGGGGGGGGGGNGQSSRTPRLLVRREVGVLVEQQM